MIRLVEGDITKVPVDAIANAANSSLAGGGGVDGAIHRAGGPEIMRELRAFRSCPTGSAVATSAGNLPAKWVFHAVGPIFRGGEHGEADQLASCYQTCLRMADEREAVSIHFPSISTGAYGYPVADAAEVALETVAKHIVKPETSLREIVFVLFDQKSYNAYAKKFQKW